MKEIQDEIKVQIKAYKKRINEIKRKVLSLHEEEKILLKLIVDLNRILGKTTQE